jgi:hypothetical protein
MAVNGVIGFGLVPNIGSTPAGTSYYVKYQVTSQWFTETWIVPQVPNPCKLTDVRALSAPIPDIMIPIDQVLPPSDAIPGEALIWTSEGWQTSAEVGTFTPFSLITTETNSTATMTVQEGASIVVNPLLPGIIEATELATDTSTPVVINGSAPTHAGMLLISQPGNATAIWADPQVQGLYAAGDSIASPPAYSAPTTIQPVLVGAADPSGDLQNLNVDAEGNLKSTVEGTVTAVQPSGSNLHVNVDNFPSVGSDVTVVGPVDGSGNVKVVVENLPSTQPVSGTVDVGNFPSTQNVNVENFPSTQPVSGTVTARIEDSSGNALSSSGAA